MSADPVSLIEKVHYWAERVGFPLEMRLRSHFSKAGFDLAQPAFLDASTEKYRAGSDVAAYKSAVVSADGGHQFRAYAFAVVECKHGGNKPWVAFLHPHDGHGITMVQQLTSVEQDRAAIEQLTHPHRRKDIQPKLLRHGMLIAPSHVAYAVSEFEGARDRSPPYDAIRQVIDGSVGVVTEHKRYFSEPQHKNNAVFAAANFVVTSSPLFTCDLNNDGELVVEQVDSFIYVDYRGQGQYQRMHYVRVATETFLADKLLAIGEDLQTIASSLVEVVAERKRMPPPPDVA
jgi:hypothetical protein